MNDVRQTRATREPHSPHRPRAVPVFLDTHVFDRRTTELGLNTDKERCEVLGIEPSRLSRLRTQKISAGADLVFDLPKKLDIDTHLLFFKEEQ